jgi:hypothetical protein
VSYYSGCQLKITIPPDKAADEDAIRAALNKKLPGVGIEFISTANARRPTVAEAFVPDNHPMNGMRRQDFGSTEIKPVAGQTLLGIALEVLEDFNV